MRNGNKYTKDFFRKRKEGALTSAEVVVPMVVDLIQPKSVIDVGCGTGEFLNVFKESGIKDFLGVDGEYAKNDLVIPQENFVAIGLENSLKIDRKFDLVVCLEVAEHLSASRAKGFVKELMNLAPIILFSAAIPGQGGTNHVNEQWITYWIDLFAENNYLPVDAIRKHIWRDKRVKPWYRQNIIILCKNSILDKDKVLAKEYRLTNRKMLSVVLPEIFDYYINKNGKQN